MSRLEKILDMEIIRETPKPVLPSWGGSQELPKDLINARIINIGRLDGRDDQDSFAIDYIPKGRKTVRRIAFGFNDCGLWIHE